MSYPHYPISSLETEIVNKSLLGSVLIEAEPGAGKSTLVPLWMLDGLAEGKKAILVQPRVLAAQAIAARLSDLVGAPLGDVVGYRVAYDARVSKATRLEVVTPGVLVQQLLNDPFSEEIECVLLDEVHERSEAQDLLWAFLQEIRILRPELKVLAMSATPDPQWKQSVDHHLYAAGRCFPVTTAFRSMDIEVKDPKALALQVYSALNTLSDWQHQCVLVFLPGWREIEACYQLLGEKVSGHKICRLHSQVDAREQRLALDEQQGPRVILATNVAETSITIPDVTLVVDSGLARKVEYEQRTGVSRLRLGRISQASADQRRGRAGRVREGHCIRLWSNSDVLAPVDIPEIRATDVLPLALRLAHWQDWGSSFKDLPWLEKPNFMALDAAMAQLEAMGFVKEMVITETGRKVAALGTHPRIAALLLSKQGVNEHSRLLALALHFEWNIESDLDDYLHTAQQELAKNKRWQALANRWERILPVSSLPIDLALLLAEAFPDRIGSLQVSGRYRLNSGMSVGAWGKLSSEWAVFPRVAAQGKLHQGLGVALALSRTQLKTFCEKKSQLVNKNNEWNWQHEWIIGGNLVDSENSPASAQQVVDHLLSKLEQQIAARGLVACIKDPRALALLQRAQLAQGQMTAPYASLDEGSLRTSLENWLQPFLQPHHDLETLPWLSALEFLIGYEGLTWLDAVLPAAIKLPSGREVYPVVTDSGEASVSAKLQEFFGCESLSWGKSNLVLRIELLSPNGSPLAITRDLKNFWQNAYKEVCKEMRGRYPRHPWPDNPMEHQATALTKKKLQQQQ